MSQLKQLIHEMHQRSLWQVLLVYVGGALVAYQVVQALTEGLGLPQWFPGLAVGLFVIGLPIVVATALVQEVAPHVPPTATDPERVEAETAAARRDARQRRRFMTWRNAGLSFLVVLAVWGVVATGWLLLGSRSAVPGVERKSIAVLPFENLSPDPDNAFFADGIHEEIISQLGKIASLHVMSRTSVMEYRGQRGNLREIAGELGVTNVLEGTVRRAGDRVRITTQLIDAESDVHLWSENYERQLSDIFAVQADIAHRVTTALEAELSSEEEESVAARPTEDLEAYDYYLKAREYLGRPGVRLENFQNALRMLEQAVELDPRFATAYANLSYVHAYFYEYALDRSEERLRRSWEAANLALQIDPDLSYGHRAMSSYYYTVGEYGRALEELAIAERGMPGSGLWVRGLIMKRQGEWDEALANLEDAVALSPRDPGLLFLLAQTLNSLRRYEEAETSYRKTLELQPDNVEARLAIAMIPVWRDGDTRPMRTLLDGIPPGFDPWGLVTMLRWYAEYYDRDYAAALEVLSHSDLEYFEWGSSGFAQFFVPRTFYLARCYVALGQVDLAHAAADSARRDLEARLREQPDDPRIISSLSLAHALLGDKEAAVREGQRAAELEPISEDAVDGTHYVLNLGYTYAWFGDVDGAVEQFDRYLSVPVPGSIAFIKADPWVDRVRDHPRFQGLVAKYE
jgi:TolB-like protein/Tfp pilus assembly protein PilF